MARHVVLGKGPVGSAVAAHLATQGHEVLLLSRSGGAPSPEVAPWSSHGLPDDVTCEAVDALDAARLAAAARGADAVINCAAPPYHRWPQEWPPLAAAVLAAAERTGAVLVTAGNLYGYGAGTGLMTETSPLRSTERKGLARAQVWAEAERRHRSGALRATEVRGSDYVGPGAVQSHAGRRMLAPLLAGRTVRPIGSVDQPHSWTYLPDFAAALAAAATREAAWGRAWHAPSPEPRTFRELVTAFARAAGVPQPRLAPLSVRTVRALGLVSPLLRELAAVGHQLTAPFVMDSTDSQEVLGVTPTPWPTIVEETLTAWRGPDVSPDRT